MKLVFIIGDAAVGKMTVGQELMKITDLRLFHNHMTIEPVLEIFGDFNGAAITKLRHVIFEEFAETDKYGMIFTYMWAFDMQSDWDYIEYVKSIFKPYGSLLLPPKRGLKETRRKTACAAKPQKEIWMLQTKGLLTTTKITALRALTEK